MKFDLRQTAKEKIILVAHRGVAGGNIPCNTITSYETALKQGADMIEIDVTMSKDGKLYIFHPGMEKAHLNMDCHIEQMNSEEVNALRFVNQDNSPTQFGLNTLDEVLEQFKGRCYINCDKFWDHPREISDAIRAHGMLDQIVVKSSPKTEILDIVEEYAPEVYYLPIVRKDDGIHEEMMRRNINYVGCEVVFTDENEGVGSTAFIDKLHADNKLVWANAIIYNYKSQLAAGHSDDTSFTVSPDYGWGWLADRGYDIIQTDWTLAMCTYLNETGKRFKK